MTTDDDRPEWVYDRADERAVERDLAPGLTARVFAGEGAMLSFVHAEPGAEGDLHSHPEEQWGFLVEGEVIRIQAGTEYHATAGEFWHTPGGVEHTIRAGETGALVLDVFGPPRPAYRESGEGFEE